MLKLIDRAHRNTDECELMYDFDTNEFFVKERLRLLPGIPSWIEHICVPVIYNGNIMLYYGDQINLLHDKETDDIDYDLQKVFDSKDIFYAMQPETDDLSAPLGDVYNILNSDVINLDLEMNNAIYEDFYLPASSVFFHLNGSWYGSSSVYFFLRHNHFRVLRFAWNGMSFDGLERLAELI